jgi:hypothetical protein
MYPAGFPEHLGDRAVDRELVADVHLDGSQVDVMLTGVLRGVLCCLFAVAVDVAHAGVSGVTGVGKRASGHRTETAGGPTDEDGLGHEAPLKIVLERLS